MGKESVVTIGGHQYRYEYDGESGKTIYKGPVGSAPELGEAEFLSAVSESRKLEKFRNFVEQFVEGKREKDRKWHEEAGIRYRDPFEDLKITDEYSYVYSTTNFRTGEIDYHSKDAGADLYVIFDGSAYDYFAQDSILSGGGYGWELINEAKKYGYSGEWVDNITLGFYPE
jgi:hypothetical protein